MACCALRARLSSQCRRKWAIVASEPGTKSCHGVSAPAKKACAAHAKTTKGPLGALGRLRHLGDAEQDDRNPRFQCITGEAPHTRSQNCLDFSTPDLRSQNYSCKSHAHTAFCFYYTLPANSHVLFPQLYPSPLARRC